MIDARAEQNQSEAYKNDMEQAHKHEEEIISFLSDTLSEQRKHDINIEIKKNPLWLILNHLNLGMYIRNLLRENGYNYHDNVMDEMWITWILKTLPARAL